MLNYSGNGRFSVNVILGKAGSGWFRNVDGVLRALQSHFRKKKN